MIKKIAIPYIFLFVLILSCCFGESQETSLDYSISSQLENEQPALVVKCKFQGCEDGITEIILPSSWAGKEELYLAISNLQCTSPQSFIENTEQPEVKRIHHPPGKTFEFVYHVTSVEKEETEWYYRPIVKDSHFFFFGHCFFAIPKVDDQAKAKISIEWKGFPSDWNLANSFGARESKQQLFEPLTTFLQAVYVGGDFQILQCGEEKAPIYVAIRGSWSFSHQQLLHLIQSVIMSHREFWNDFSFPYYLITVLPIGDDHHMGGTGLSNSFAIFTGDLSEDNQEDWKWLAWLLSHEHFHTWNGIKMMSEPPEELLYWFTEGFTEYFSVKLNSKCKLIDIDDYVIHINTILYDYYTSPVHRARNERLLKDFWIDWDVQRLPYVRGFLFALRWDKKIQRTSNGEFSLDDFMLALFKKSQEKEKTFSQEDIELVASEFLPIDEVRDDIQQYIIEGKTLVPEEVVEGEYRIEWMEDIGFNLPQTISNGRIVGVKQGSNASRAGLKNGQEFQNYSQTDLLISVSVIDFDGAIKEFSYAKNQESRSIPYYKHVND